ATPHQHERLAALTSKLSEANKVAKLVAPDLANIARAFHRYQARLLCTRVGLAVERYRLANNSFPDKLSDLVPKYLPAVPLDPFDGKPLRYRAEGALAVVVYSVGQDRVDNLGHLQRLNTNQDGTDLGFRLWAPAHRRQP